jgi:transcriptional regulator with XRE-family HTH domain
MLSSEVLADFRLASPGEVVKALGRRLRDQRASQSLTQMQLATRAGVALGAVKKLEATGRVTMETLVQVVVALGLVAEFNSIFAIRAQASIAEMKRQELARRKRVRKPSIPVQP